MAPSSQLMRNHTGTADFADSHDIHDKIIVATALLYRDVLRQEVAVGTKDEMIAGSGLISVIW